jgi:small multidrug resistance pump
MPPGALLTVAIAIEVGATIALRQSDGFTRPVPTAVMAVGYLTAFYLLSLTLRTIPVSVTYAIWSAVGTALLAVVGILVFGESANGWKIVSLVLIVVGVVGLNISGSTHE